MFPNSTKIMILVMMLVLFFAGEALGQTKVLGLFQLGKSTYIDVKINLPKKAKIILDHLAPCDYGGPCLTTDGKGFGIDGLKGVDFAFNQKQVLAVVFMSLEVNRFNDIKGILSSKYRQIRSYPGVSLLFKANQDYVYLDYPRDANVIVEYMTSAVYKENKLRERQTVEYNKRYDLENKQRLERERAAEAEKF